MITLNRTNSSNQDFINLVKLLDAELKIRDGEDHDFYNQFNSIDMIKHAIVAYQNDKPVGCGAIKEYDSKSMEVKRMFVKEDARGNGIASLILKELEDWAKEMNFTKCILETGHQQPEAINLYKKSNYQITANYGQYEGVDNSVCFAKKLK